MHSSPADYITTHNIKQWVNIFRINADKTKDVSAKNVQEKIIEASNETIKIYNKILEFVKQNKLANKNDLRILESRFEIQDRINNKLFRELEGIRQTNHNLASVYKNIAETHYKNKEYTEALEILKTALLLNPTCPFVNYMLGRTLRVLTLNKEAAYSFEEALRYDKNNHEIRRILGEIYIATKDQDIDKAVHNYGLYLKFNQDCKSAMTNLALAYGWLGMQERSDHWSYLALQKDPGNEALITIHMLNYLKIQNITQDQIKIRSKEVIENFIKANNLEKNIYDFTDRKENERIKIGYVSSDFYHHVVSRFILPVIESHNKEKFEIYLYSNVKKEDSMTKYYRSVVKDNFIDCSKFTNEEFSNKIYTDNIDILVDLNIFTGQTRIYSLISKPAPIQAVYLGYPNTSGLDTIDYILTDKNTIKPEEQIGYTEKLAFIDAGYETYKLDSKGIPEVSPPPLRQNKYVTFGVFNAASKVTTEIIAVWANILRNVKKSKILFQYINYYTPCNQERIIKEFAQYKISKDRIIFHGKDPKTHYNKMQLADVALDTHPYSGTGTTFDSLLMGLPVICLEGHNSSSRPTSRILKTLNLDELIAQNKAEYVRIATNLATKAEAVMYYRATVKNKLINSKLLEHKDFTRSLEKTYEKIWKEYKSKQSS